MRGLRHTVLFVPVLLWAVSGQLDAQQEGDHPPRPVTVPETCIEGDCHLSQRQHKVLHRPAEDGKCQVCHVLVDAESHQFDPAGNDGDLCGACHVFTLRMTVHEPVEQGKCVGCHDPHGSAHRLMLRAEPAESLCQTCHQREKFTDRKHQHEPVEVGACILCHDPHSSWQPDLLVTDAAELCRRCHEEVLNPPGGQPRHVHAALQDGCVVCHDPHASDQPYQLRSGSPDLCFSCHRQTEQTIAKAATVHGAVTQPGGCSTCHAPHHSELPNLQRDNQLELCLSCHDRQIARDDDMPVSSLAIMRAKDATLHAPVRLGGCSACHQPHAGERAQLLVQAYPPEFYADFTEQRYQLCFNCHMADLVRTEDGVGLTRFRDGPRNLHWLHVNRPKGRTCRACHDVHASRNPFHMRDAVPYGNAGWELEIHYEQTEDGGSCSPGCHETKSYGRSAKVPAAADTVPTPESPDR